MDVALPLLQHATSPGLSVITEGTLRQCVTSACRAKCTIYVVVILSLKKLGHRLHMDFVRKLFVNIDLFFSCYWANKKMCRLQGVPLRGQKTGKCNIASTADEPRPEGRHILRPTRTPLLVCPSQANVGGGGRCRLLTIPAQSIVPMS